MNKLCDEIIWVDGDYDVLLERLMTTRGHTKEYAQNILETQKDYHIYKNQCYEIYPENGKIESLWDEFEKWLNNRENKNIIPIR